MAGRLIGPVAAARQALIYQHFLDHIEPAERRYHEADVPDWLLRTAALAAGGASAARGRASAVLRGPTAAARGPSATLRRPAGSLRVPGAGPSAPAGARARRWSRDGGRVAEPGARGAGAAAAPGAPRTAG